MRISSWARSFCSPRSSRRRAACVTRSAWVRVEVLEPRQLLATMQFTPVADNTLYESAAGDLSNGAGQHLYVGTTGQTQGNVRRATLKFDVSALPAGATIDSVTLTMQMSKTVSAAQNVVVHRALSDWGEGPSNASQGGAGPGEGDGVQAASGDATWLHRFFNNQFWATPGGDFVAAGSATAAVSGVGSYQWTSAGLLDDVQQWQANPSENFGWILTGNEAAIRTAKEFGSRNNATAANRPTLTVVFTTPSPDLTVTKTHTGNFQQGAAGASYTIEVRNVGAGPTDGSTVSLVDTLPTGLTATGFAGAGWAVDVGTLTATRTDVLAAGASYPSLTLTVNVASTASSQLTNTVTVSGGGDVVTANNVASDLVTVTPAATLLPTLALTSTGSPLSQTVLFFRGGDNQIYEVKLDGNQNIVAPAALVQAGAVGSSLAAVTLPNGSPVLFLVGSDNQVYKANFDPSGNIIGGFALTQAGAIQSMTATTDAAGNPMLLVIGSDSQVYFQRFDANGNQSAGYALTSGGAVQSLSASGPTLFAQGLDNQLYQNRFNGTAWAGYNLPAGGAVQSYTFSAASGLLLGIGGDNQLYAQRIDAAGGTSGWFLTAPGAIAAVTQDLYSGKAVAFVLGADNQVYSQRFDAAGSSLGYAATAPGAVKFIYASGLPGSPGVFAVGADNQVYKLRFDNVTGAVIGGFSAAGTGPVT